MKAHLIRLAGEKNDHYLFTFGTGGKEVLQKFLDYSNHWISSVSFGLEHEKEIVLLMPHFPAKHIMNCCCKLYYMEEKIESIVIINSSLTGHPLHGHSYFQWEGLKTNNAAM